MENNEKCAADYTSVVPSEGEDEGRLSFSTRHMFVWYLNFCSLHILFL